MPKLTFLPHEVICPDGAEIDANEGETILNAALSGGVSIEHACEKSCACTTCHVVVRNGFFSLTEADENEEDYIVYHFDTPWGPPNEIYDALIERFKNIHVQWFYDEPGMGFAGYLPE